MIRFDSNIFQTNRDVIPSMQHMLCTPEEKKRKERNPLCVRLRLTVQKRLRVHQVEH